MPTPAELLRQDEPPAGRAESSSEAHITALNQDHWCFAWPAASRVAVGKERAAMVKNSKWNSGALITISFLDGSRDQRDRVRQFARGWIGPRLARLTLNFLDETTDTACRISFAHKGSWSTVGTTCRKVPKGEATMNFGWLEGASDDEARRVVLHEFGHLLGLIHEHQVPDAPIEWNRDAVRAELSSVWSDKMIEHNIFQPAKKGETNSTGFDAESIMIYPIPQRWTTNGFSAELNADLSTRDKAFIHQQYE